MSVLSHAFKVRGTASSERSGYDPSYSVLSREYLPCRSAVFIELFRRNYILMGGDLKYRVGRCINDQSAGTQMLLSVVPDDICTGVYLIAQRSSPCPLLKFIYYTPRKSVGISRKRLFSDQSCYLPMTCSGILACRSLQEPCKAALRPE